MKLRVRVSIAKGIKLQNNIGFIIKPPALKIVKM